MPTKRLFLGVRPSPAILKDLLSVQQELREEELLRLHRKACRWLTEDSIHLTLHFLGSVDTSGVEPICERAARAAVTAPCHEQPMDELVFFPSPLHARVGAIGAFPATGDLQRLREELGRGLKELAIPIEDRPFHPHVTLVRFHHPASLFELRRASPVIRYPIDHIALYESLTGPDGSRYEILREFPLAPHSPA